MPFTKPHPIIIKICFAIGLILLFSSCSEKTDSTSTQSNTTSDSIAIWFKVVTLPETTEANKSIILQKALKKTQGLRNDSLKGQYLTSLSYCYLLTHDSLTFRQVNELAVAAAYKQNDSLSLANLHWDLASFFDRKSIHRDSSYYHYNAAEKIFSTLGNTKSSGRMLIQLAKIQNLIGDYTGSNTTAIKAIEKLKVLNEFRHLQRSYAVLGDNAKLLNEFDQSIEYYQEALSNLEKNGGNLLEEISLKNGLGLVHRKKGAYAQAIPYFNEVLGFDSLRTKRPLLYGRALNNLGYSYLKTNTTAQLPTLFYNAIAIQDSIGDIIGKSSSAHGLAEYFISQNDTTHALQYLNQAKTFALQSNNNKRLLKILRMFRRVDPANASKYTKAYLVLNDSLLLQERQIRDKFARIRFETDEFIAENEHLARQKQLWTGIAIGALLLGFATFIIFTQRAKNQKLRFEKEQQASNQEIFNLLLAQQEKVEEAKKSEQKRVSEELHDGVLGKMLGARMMLIGLNKRPDPEAIAERAKAISILQDVEHEVRSISHELSHAAYQKIHNFIRAVEDVLKTVESSSKIKINFDYADDLDYDALSGDIKINLFRMIQESIQNAVKHADCKHIHLNFGADAKDLKIVIADDGKGYIVKKSKKGIGMRNIASRIEKVKGTWHIDSVIGKGTTVTLNIPIVTIDNSTTIKINEERF